MQGHLYVSHIGEQVAFVLQILLLAGNEAHAVKFAIQESHIVSFGTVFLNGLAGLYKRLACTAVGLICTAVVSEVRLIACKGIYNTQLVSGGGQ